MEQTTKDAIFHDMIRKFAEGGKGITTAAFRDFVEAQNDDLRTGPEIGENIPDFTLLDQHGKSWTPDDLMGTNGLLLVFSRSADW